MRTYEQKRDAVIAAAIAEIGTVESPANSNRTKYGQWYGLDGVKWCAIFVSYVFDKAGVPLGNIHNPHGFQACDSAYYYWKRSGELTTNPQPGDIVLFDWNGDKVADHVGIVEKVGPTHIDTIEGNTAFGDDSNGGKVMRRRRARNAVRAFVHPLVYHTQTEEPVLEQGQLGADVADVQRSLKAVGYDVAIDGQFGPKTLAALQNFQQQHGLAQSGKADSATLQALKLAESTQVVPNPTTGSFLKQGSSGFAVYELQKDLNLAGANPAVKVDGDFGAGTETALKAFQTKHGLKADGIAGPKTLAALQTLATAGVN